MQKIQEMLRGRLLLALLPVALLALALGAHTASAAMPQQERLAPTDCQGDCRIKAKELYAACVADGNAAEDCRAKVGTVLSDCLAKCPSDERPDPGTNECQGKCREEAVKLQEACVADGNAPEDCRKKVGAVLRDCVAKCPSLERPDPVAGACEGKCREMASKAYEACVADGNAPEDCRAKAGAAMRECLAKCPSLERPDPGTGVRPPQQGKDTCETACAKRAKALYDRCVAGDGTPEACRRRAAEAKRECVEKCPRTVRPDPGTGERPPRRGERPDPGVVAPATCQTKCGMAARRAHAACVADGGDATTCREEAVKMYRTCIADNCPRERPEPDPGRGVRPLETNG